MPLRRSTASGAATTSFLLVAGLLALGPSPLEAATLVPGAGPGAGPLRPGQRPAAEEGFHIVQPGETLMGIARRYGVSLEALVQANGIANPNLIFAGQRLRIPGQPAAPTPPSSVVHLIRRGETLRAIARQHGTTVDALVLANGLANPNLILAGQVLRVPASVTPADPLQVSTLAPQQGGLALLRLAGVREATGMLEGQPVPFAREGQAFYALVGFAPWSEPGVRTLTVSFTTESGQARTASRQITVRPGAFPLERWSDPSLLPEFPAQAIAAERERLAALFDQFTPERLWSGAFRYPLQRYRLTSGFGTRRAFGTAPPSWWHEGLDLAAPVGTPVYAPAAGRVVLAEMLQVRGGAVLLDHGWGVHSGYWHLSEVSVSPGAVVRAGDLLGRVGSTGLASGPHLHWEIRVGQAPVEPAAWLAGVGP